MVSITAGRGHVNANWPPRRAFSCSSGAGFPAPSPQPSPSGRGSLALSTACLSLWAHRYTQIRYCENRVGKIAGLKSGRLVNGLKAEKGKCRSPQATCRGSGGVPQYKFPLFRARERGIKGGEGQSGKEPSAGFYSFLSPRRDDKKLVYNDKLGGRGRPSPSGKDEAG